MLLEQARAPDLVGQRPPEPRAIPVVDQPLERQRHMRRLQRLPVLVGDELQRMLETLRPRSRGAIGVNVDPLEIECGFCEVVDATLIDQDWMGRTKLVAG